MSETQNPDYDPADIALLFQAEHTHFWFKSRKEKILTVLKRVANTKDRVLEAGAGTGHLSAALQKKGYDVTAADIHLFGMQYAKGYGVKKCCVMDLLHPPFLSCFDVVALFDVIEHLDDDAGAIAAAYSVLHDRGLLVLTVPAFSSLWSAADDAGRHKRRYTLPLLHRKIATAGFKVAHAEYFFTWMLPLLVLRKFLMPGDKKRPDSTNFGRMLKISPVINTVFLGLSRIENRVKEMYPGFYGGSILLVAEKSANNA